MKKNNLQISCRQYPRCKSRVSYPRQEIRLRKNNCDLHRAGMSQLLQRRFLPDCRISRGISEALALRALIDYFGALVAVLYSELHRAPGSNIFRQLRQAVFITSSTLLNPMSVSSAITAPLQIGAGVDSSSCAKGGTVFPPARLYPSPDPGLLGWSVKKYKIYHLRIEPATQE